MGKRETDEKKEYLNQYSDTLAAVERINCEIRELNRTEGFSRINTFDTQIFENNKKDLSDYLVKKEELIREMYKARYKRIQEYQKIFKAIEELPTERERKIITLRYLRRQTWEKIAVQMHMEWAQVHRIHAKALEHFVIPK